MRKTPVNKDGTTNQSWKHGQSHTPLYAVWNTMLQRCYNPKHNRYRLYGGRGIRVCEEWWEFPTFKKWATRRGYKKGLNIDRRDTDGNYEPSNCRWITAQRNQRNRRNNRILEVWGEQKSLADWADDKRCVVPYKKLWERLQDGWASERALTFPERRQGGYRLIEAFGETKSITEWVQDPRCKVTSVPTLWARINRGWSPERAITTVQRKR